MIKKTGHPNRVIRLVPGRNIYALEGDDDPSSNHREGEDK